MATKTPAVRYHDLDALRAVAMLLGVVLHSLLFLMPDPKNLWPVQEVWGTLVQVETNPYVHGFLLIHGFRMPLFFIISGFFTAMLWQRRGLWPLAEHRVKRIAIPLALCVITVIPVCAWIYSVLETETFGEFNPLLWPLALFRPRTGFFHLWFLWQLLLIIAFFVVAVRLGAKFVSPGWWLLVPLSLLTMFAMNEPIFGPDTSQSVIPNLDVLGFYTIFFFFGVFFYQRGFKVARWWMVAIIPALFAYVGGLVFILSEIQSVGWAITSAFQIAYAWLMAFGMMGLFRYIAGKERFLWRYVSDSSYWLYLWHLPLVIIMQELLLNVEMNVHLKFLVVFVTVTALLLATYQYGVRYTWIGKMLNGKRSRTQLATAKS